MLRDGQFIKEPRIEIGAHYVPYAKPKLTNDDIFMQDILSKQCISMQNSEPNNNSKIIDWVVFVCIIWFCIAIFVPVLKILVEYLVG